MLFVPKWLECCKWRLKIGSKIAEIHILPWQDVKLEKFQLIEVNILKTFFLVYNKVF